MPKLYLGPGLSSRVHQALCRRLEQFMAANAEAAGQREASEFPRTENPPLGSADANETEGGKEDDPGSPPPPEESSRSPMEREDDDRSRSPRMRSPEVSVQSTNELLSATTSMAVGITSMVGALKDSTNKLEAVLQQTQSLQRDLCKSLEVVSGAITGMARGIESLSGGVSYNTGRVGALVGEITKLRKHVEWSLDVSMKDTLKANQKGREERDQTQRELLEQLFEAMDKLQENLKQIAGRIEQIPMNRGKGSEYDPPQAPTTPMMPPPVMTVGSSGTPVPPPPTMPATLSPQMIPPKPLNAGPGNLPIVKFAGYSPARSGEACMSHALALEVTDIKVPAYQVYEEVTGRIRGVSPTARHSPQTGTAAFAPLGYVQVKGTSEFRRVYP